MQNARMLIWLAGWAVAAGCGPKTSGPGPGGGGGGGGGGAGGAGGAGDAGAGGEVVAAPVPPTFRLPGNVKAVEYEARLAIDPAVATFSGTLTMHALVGAPTDVVWLNAENLTITRAMMRPVGEAAGMAWTALDVLPVPHDFVGFRAASPLMPGEVTIAIEYRGAIDENDTRGVFRQKEGEDWYVYTQFEPLSARRTFPCIDEPDSKVPWTLSLEVPAAQVALANAAVARTEPIAGTDRALVTFEESAPLPTYLLAFAVGPFELVDAGTSAAGTPLRVVTMKGRSAEAAWAVETTKPLLALLEDYFGTPYPYSKLDALTIPLTVGFGAMEHPGLITYSERAILLPAPPEEAPLFSRVLWTYYAGHEMAHQWFGNLVTPAFWNDLWLNEAFASWMEPKVVAGFRAAWRADEIAAGQAADVIADDSLASARRINQPVESNDDILASFDGITYQKGAAVISMFERWVGATVFRDGVRAHLAKFAWGNATSADFLASIGAAAGVDVATPFSTFLDQVGAPEVQLTLQCAADQAPSLALAQQRFLPPGSKASAAQTWQVPVCVRWGAGKTVRAQCTLLTTAQAVLPLEGATRCPDWVLGNADGAGYYRTVLDPGAIAPLLAAWKKLTGPEKTVLSGDVEAMLEAGRIDVGAAMGLVRLLAADASPMLVERGAKLVAALGALVPTARRTDYAREVRAIFGARAKKLGWEARRGSKHAEEEEALRNFLVPLVAIEGEEPALRKAAVKMATRWLGDRSGAARAIVPAMLATALAVDPAAVFDAAVTAVSGEPDGAARRAILEALGGLRDPAYGAKAMELLASDRVDIREAMYLLRVAPESPTLRGTAWAYLRDHADALLAALPVEARAELAHVGGAACDAGQRDAIVAFLEAHIAKQPAGPLAVAQAVEELDLCIARGAAMRPRVEAYYAK